MQPRKYFKLLGISLFGAFFALSSSFAADINVSEQFNISVGGRNYQIFISSDALDEIQVTETTFTLKLAPVLGGKVEVSSPDRMDIGGTNNSLRENLSLCNESESRLKVVASATSIISVTVTPPAAGTVCTAGNITSGGGSSGPSGGPPSSTPPVVQPEVEEEKLFKDLKKSQEKYVLPVVRLMLEKFTYEVPGNKLFGVSKVTNGYFAAQIAAAVSGVGCGSDSKFPGGRACFKALKVAKVLPKRFPGSGKLRLVKYYELLLAAKNIPLQNGSVAALKKSCTDVKKASSLEAKVYVTAKAVGIVSKFKGGKCLLQKNFNRADAAKIALRAMGVGN